jgi:hypothetical protein
MAASPPPSGSGRSRNAEPTGTHRRSDVTPTGSLPFVAAALAALTALAPASVARAATSGAIFTTDVTGNFVNGNVYENRADVYLNGGPRANAPCTAAGLTDGDYYFQVTDPSGQEVLSPDDIANRRVTVTGGVISAYSGTHLTGPGTCGSITVQLCPFHQSPNEGDEYKVWMTPVENNGTFSRSASKTDNFKVTGTDACPSGGD